VKFVVLTAVLLSIEVFWDVSVVLSHSYITEGLNTVHMHNLWNYI
jgi:hypothetical protein